MYKLEADSVSPETVDDDYCFARARIIMRDNDTTTRTLETYRYSTIVPAVCTYYVRRKVIKIFLSMLLAAFSRSHV
jgi:hypothetical protein